MPRLYLFAEGQTEQTFAGTVLQPHLANRGVYLHSLLVANAKRKGRVYRGGLRTYEPMRNDILRLLAQEKSGDVCFTTMIDLYALPADFPGLDTCAALRHTPTRRVEAIERAFADDIGDLRFVPHIQLHEFEAYLFADPTWFRYLYDRSDRQVAALTAIANQFSTPELIDDGPNTAPSKRIIAHFPDYEGAKPTVGPLVAESIGLDAIRRKCPHFAAWLSRLETLGE